MIGEGFCWRERRQAIVSGLLGGGGCISERMMLDAIRWLTKGMQ